MSGIPSLAPLYEQMVEQIRRYNDCMMTCDVPFVRKGRGRRVEMVYVLNSLLSSGKFYPFLFMIDLLPALHIQCTRDMV